MNILTAPFYALCSIDFYRKVAASPLWKGFVYLLYLCLITVVILLLLFFFKIVPIMDQFVGWAKTQMPTITWTPTGISIDRPSPYTMRHPQWGPLVTFDTAKTDVSIDAMSSVPVFVTSKKIFVKERAGEMRIYDLQQGMRERETKLKGQRLDAQTLDRFYVSLKPILLGSAVVFWIPFFFLWKLVSALFYSLFGLLFNNARQNKLPYAAVLNVSLFALTGAFFIQILQLLVPALNRVPLGFFGSLIVTSIYLFLGIKKAEGVEPAAL